MGLADSSGGPLPCEKAFNDVLLQQTAELVAQSLARLEDTFNNLLIRKAKSGADVVHLQRLVWLTAAERLDNLTGPS